MNWLINTLGTSIGKKLMMAVTGLAFIAFLAAHLAGNLTLYGGPDTFNSYAEHLHALGPLVTIFEWCLMLLALVHILTGTFLYFQNLAARPLRYKVNKRGGGRTLGSATMPYTGMLILLFVIFHLANFRFIDPSHTSLFQVVSGAFAHPLYVGVYVFSMVVVAIHVSHGFWSLFQSLGLSHPKYMPFLRGLGIVVSLIFGIGFGFLPIYISFIA